MEMKPASMPRGTRVSRRLRDTEDEWQQVPTEWLGDQNGNGASNSKRSSRSGAAGNGTKRKKPLDEDEESELSELTDEEEHTASMAAAGPGQNGKQGDETMDVDQVSTRPCKGDLSLILSRSISMAGVQRRLSYLSLKRR
jgi:hypothetical protein